MIGTERDIAVEVRGIREVFGPQAMRVLEGNRRESLGAAEVQGRFGREVGAFGAILASGRGKVVRVLRLSGPCKSALLLHARHLIAPTSGTNHIQGRNAPGRRRRGPGETAGSGWMGEDCRVLDVA